MTLACASSLPGLSSARAPILVDADGDVWFVAAFEHTAMPGTALTLTPIARTGTRTRAQLGYINPATVQVCDQVQSFRAMRAVPAAHGRCSRKE